VAEIVGTGETKFADPTHLWAYKVLPGRQDNLICAVLVLADKIIVKIVMRHFAYVDLAESRIAKRAPQTPTFV